jgi:WD40 repeat protein
MNLNIRKTFTLKDHDAPVYSLEAFNEYAFFSGGGDRIVSLNSLTSGSVPSGIVNTGSTIYSLNYLPEKNILLAGVSGGGMHVIDFNQKKEIHFLLFHTLGIYDIKYAPKNKMIVTAGGDGKLACWSSDDFSFLRSLHLCRGKLRSVAIDKEEENIAVACGDGTIRIIALKSMDEVYQIAAHTTSVNAVIFHPTRNLLLSGGRDAHVKAWDTRGFDERTSIPAHNYAIYSIAFSPDAAWFATASRDRTIKIWSSDSLNFLHRIDKEKLDGHAFSVNKILWMKDALLSASDDKTIMGWKIEPGVK